VNESSRLRQTSRTSASVGSDRGRQGLAPPRMNASRSSIASSVRSKSSSAHVRANVGHKRNVSFSHARKRSTSREHEIKLSDTKHVEKNPIERHSNHTEVTDNGGDSLRRVDLSSAAYIRSKKHQAMNAQPLMSATKPGRASQMWNEDVRQLSSSLAMDCDEAFNITSERSNTRATGHDTLGTSVQSSRIARKPSPPASQPTANRPKARIPSLDSRPLPPPPARSDSTRIELMKARREAQIRKASGASGDSPRYLDRLVSHINGLMEPSSPERRTLSAPLEARRNISGRPLPSINEGRKEEDSPRRPTDYEKYMESQHGFKPSRNASAPEPREAERHRNDRFLTTNTGARGTIRVVEPSSPSPVEIPAPLTIRKQSSRGPANSKSLFSPELSQSAYNASKESVAGRDRRQMQGQGFVDLDPIGENHMGGDQYGIESHTGTILVKKPTWYKRTSKLADGDYRMSGKERGSYPSHSSSNGSKERLDLNGTAPPLRKKFSLGRLFGKRSSKPDMTLEGKCGLYLFWMPKANFRPVNDQEDNESIPDSTMNMLNRSNASRTSSN